MRGRLPLAIVICFVALTAALVARAEVTVRQTSSRIVDRAGVIDPETTESLEKLLKELEKQTGAQVKVLTVRSTEGEGIFEFTQRHAELWKLGQKEKENGVLITLAVEDRHVRIHSGYGLEGVLPDSWCGTLTREVTQQYFKQKQYSAGIRKLTGAVAAEIAADAGVTLEGSDGKRFQPRRSSPLRYFVILVVILFVIASFFGRRMNRGGRGYRRGFAGSMILWGGASGWGGGSFGGGSFGGGSFGGGGGFGGAGGGGSW